ncbi:hypothetical protein IA539_03365 [Gordonia sp. zg691]|uniref:hypothetical protein n=1 Tax=Gordonia jinghuaiqii TaxID=2758710 RepID=UPI001662658A|nr:hypothetical protein [Gordonia jinghuaiqii]MBD0860247.1 hypothetical protein [Gordonia jinghuaiqii]
MPASVVVDGGRQESWTPPAPDARLVVAVGSNAAPDVLRRKLRHLPAAAPTRLVRVRVTNITVGHSAHVAARGYVPAAPVFAGQTSLVTIAAWLTQPQAAALDATEPNYDRRTVNTHDHPLIPVGPPHPGGALVALPDEFDMYVSRHGVLADPMTHETLPFGPQSRILGWLHDRLRHAALSGPAAQVCAQLATGGNAASMTARIHDAGLARRAWTGDRYAGGGGL